MIVCPVTLVDNWRKEFRKWFADLGSTDPFVMLTHDRVDRRLNVVVADGSDHQISSFVSVCMPYYTVADSAVYQQVATRPYHRL